MSKESAVTCEEVVERLPWLLNGTLEAEEAERMRAHLGTCAACRRELGETRWAAAVFGAHVVTDTLIALAWDKPSNGVDLDLARRHVQGCDACSNELAMVRESRALESAPADVLPFRPAPAPARQPLALRYGSLAAALIMGFGAGFVARHVSTDSVGTTGTALTPAPTPATPTPVTPSSDDLDRLAGRVKTLERELEQARRTDEPQVNLPIVEVLPASAVKRGGGPDGFEGGLGVHRKPAGTRIVVPAGARLVAMVLSGEKVTGPATVDIRRADGQIVWSGGELKPGPLGGYTLGVPTSLLADGDYEVVLRPQAGAPETYPIHVQHAR
jgi:hypothetical protein